MSLPTTVAGAHAVLLVGAVLAEAMVLYVSYGAVIGLVGEAITAALRGE